MFILKRYKMIKINFLEMWQRKERKENRRISPSELAQKAQVSRSTINRWRNDNVKQFDRETLENLCRYFECEIGDLLTLSPPLKDSE